MVYHFYKNILNIYYLLNNPHILISDLKPRHLILFLLNIIIKLYRNHKYVINNVLI